MYKILSCQNPKIQFKGSPYKQLKALLKVILGPHYTHTKKFLGRAKGLKARQAHSLDTNLFWVLNGRLYHPKYRVLDLAGLILLKDLLDKIKVRVDIHQKIEINKRILNLKYLAVRPEALKCHDFQDWQKQVFIEQFSDVSDPEKLDLFEWYDVTFSKYPEAAKSDPIEFSHRIFTGLKAAKTPAEKFAWVMNLNKWRPLRLAQTDLILELCYDSNPEQGRQMSQEDVNRWNKVLNKFPIHDSDELRQILRSLQCPAQPVPEDDWVGTKQYYRYKAEFALDMAEVMAEWKVRKNADPYNRIMAADIQASLKILFLKEYIDVAKDDYDDYYEPTKVDNLIVYYIEFAKKVFYEVWPDSWASYCLRQFKDLFDSSGKFAYKLAEIREVNSLCFGETVSLSQKFELIQKIQGIHSQKNELIRLCTDRLRHSSTATIIALFRRISLLQTYVTYRDDSLPAFNETIAETEQILAACPEKPHIAEGYHKVVYEYGPHQDLTPLRERMIQFFNRIDDITLTYKLMDTLEVQLRQRPKTVHGRDRFDEFPRRLRIATAWLSRHSIEDSQQAFDSLSKILCKETLAKAEIEIETEPEDHGHMGRAAEAGRREMDVHEDERDRQTAQALQLLEGMYPDINSCLEYPSLLAEMETAAGVSQGQLNGAKVNLGVGMTKSEARLRGFGWPRLEHVKFVHLCFSGRRVSFYVEASLRRLWQYILDFNPKVDPECRPEDALQQQIKARENMKYGFILALHRHQDICLPGRFQQLGMAVLQGNLEGVDIDEANLTDISPEQAGKLIAKQFIVINDVAELLAEWPFIEEQEREDFYDQMRTLINAYLIKNPISSEVKAGFINALEQLINLSDPLFQVEPSSQSPRK